MHVMCRPERTADPDRPCPYLWPFLSLHFPCMSPGAMQRQLEPHPNRRTFLTCQTPFLQVAHLAAHEGMPRPYLVPPAPAGPPACPPAPAAAPAPLRQLTWLRCVAAAAEPAGRPSAAQGSRCPSLPAGAQARLNHAYRQAFAGSCYFFFSQLAWWPCSDAVLLCQGEKPDS